MPALTRPDVPQASTAPHLIAAAGRLLQGLGRAATPARLAVGRTGAGTVMVLRPQLLPTALGVDAVSAAKTAWVVQMLGAREIALGLGTLVALRAPDRSNRRAWLAAGVLSDGIDVLAVGAALLQGRLSRSTGTLVAATALGATLAGLRALESDGTQG